eukprot:1796102-Rhodomonas_salina.1
MPPLGQGDLQVSERAAGELRQQAPPRNKTEAPAFPAQPLDLECGAWIFLGSARAGHAIPGPDALRAPLRASRLQNQLSTTANMDSPHAQKVRSELKELLAKRAELKARIQAKEARKQREVHARQISDDQDDDVLKVLSRTEDSSSTYHKWLRDASAGSRGKEEQERAVKKPVITAGGQLKWKQTGQRPRALGRVVRGRVGRWLVLG